MFSTHDAGPLVQVASAKSVSGIHVWLSTSVRMFSTHGAGPLVQSRQFEKACKQLQQQRQAGAVQAINASPLTATDTYSHLPGLAGPAFDAAHLPVSCSGLRIPKCFLWLRRPCWAD